MVAKRLSHCLLVLVITMFALSLGCSDKKNEKGSDEVGEKPPAVGSEPECKLSSDCPKGWTCLSGECVDPTLRGVSTGNAVTPDKVKKHVEDIGKKADKRGQDAIDL